MLLAINNSINYTHTVIHARRCRQADARADYKRYRIKRRAPSRQPLTGKLRR
ncbi:hypothetical protein EDWATA_02079 [Edwardsiella tarda ATCC 23685]|uniref:Uncharacterized protein n=1 Tax=Edwardsiella tarda ATCC 23685 TaxID=500638 RepID=D4F5Q2_EDWTA|nr:hypothetical protein EDWATA_02079 [Edwardsiella tarda ATCC 23685]